MAKPRVYADFHNADIHGRLRLNCVGTIEDLARQGITLRDGAAMTFYSEDLDAAGTQDELRVDGVVTFSEEEHCWVASINWSAISAASDERAVPAAAKQQLVKASNRDNGESELLPSSLEEKQTGQ